MAFLFEQVQLQRGSEDPPMLVVVADLDVGRMHCTTFGLWYRDVEWTELFRCIETLELVSPV